jgi:hypothetical protein
MERPSNMTRHNLIADRNRAKRAAAQRTPVVAIAFLRII